VFLANPAETRIQSGREGIIATELKAAALAIQLRRSVLERDLANKRMESPLEGRSRVCAQVDNQCAVTRMGERAICSVINLKNLLIARKARQHHVATGGKYRHAFAATIELTTRRAIVLQRQPRSPGSGMQIAA
jgi:hypothetical protein